MGFEASPWKNMAVEDVVDGANPNGALPLALCECASPDNATHACCR
jgi:hypothetical protein